MTNANKTVFVTTGATIPFQALIEACLDPGVLATFSSLGFTALVIQYAQASTDIMAKCSNANAKSTTTDTTAGSSSHGLAVSGFRFKPDLSADIKASDLVISHAGMVV